MRVREREEKKIIIINNYDDAHVVVHIIIGATTCSIYINIKETKLLRSIPGIQLYYIYIYIPRYQYISLLLFIHLFFYSILFYLF